MNKITGVTRRDIFDLFRKGITEDNWLITENIFYPYYGRFDIVEFLKRLYNLADWESRDSRVDNAEEEIIMHIHNGDYPDDWIFEDERFQLFDGEDNILLNFICEVFHPEVRDENGVWERYLERINALLISSDTSIDVASSLTALQGKLKDMEIPELLRLSIETGLVSISMKIMSVFITVVIYGRMIEIYLICSVAPIPFATMTNKEWGQIGNNYLKSLFALGFQGFLIMVCVGIYAVLVKAMTVSDNLHTAIFSLAAYTVLLCFMLLKSSAISKSIFGAH